MRLRKRFIAGAIATMMILGVNASAQIVFQGGSVNEATHWIDSADGSTGFPTAGETAVINVNGTINDAGVFDMVTVDHIGGNLSKRFRYISDDTIYNLAGGTLDFGGTVEVNNGGVFNLSCGVLKFKGDLIVNHSASAINVSGDAVIESYAKFDIRLQQPGASLSIDPAWTGRFIGPHEGNLDEWQRELVDDVASPNGLATNFYDTFIDVGGTRITAANFRDFFQTTPLPNRATALSLIPIAAVPEIVVEKVGANIVIMGTQMPDEIIVTQNSNLLEVSVGNVCNETFPLAAIDRIVVFGYGGSDLIQIDARVETTVHGGFGADMIFGGNLSADIFGGPGPDLIVGGPADDSLNGGRGNDYINGRAGNDELLGGYATDTVMGGAGNDMIYGGLGSDDLFGGNGDDLLVGNAGADTLNGNGGNDDLIGHGGSDKLFGGPGNDDLTGGAAFDTLNGGGGVDAALDNGEVEIGIEN